MNVQVTKRNGTTEDLDLNKIHKILECATQDLNDVSVSDIEINAQLSFHDGISTKEIHEVLTRSTADLISEDYPNYQYVAARLLLYDLRKSVWGESEPPRLLEHIKQCISYGVYDSNILTKYTESEIHKLGKYIRHNRDEKFTFAGLQQLVDKYLVKNRKTEQVYETPQFAYMLIAMTLFQEYGKERISYVRKAYDFFSKHKISMSTPVMAGVRTNVKSYTSCNLLSINDNMDSILSNVEAVGKLISRRAGIGLNIGRIRAIGSEVRGGDVIHTGVIPFLKVFESLVNSCAQGGLRKGSATVFCPFFHYEIENVVVLKNNAGTDENRVRHLDYGVVFSKLFYDRVKEDKDITLFSPHEVEELLERFGYDDFDKLYEQYERKHLKHKKKIKARKLLELFTRERLETGRIYLLNIDHANKWPWNEHIEMSNLCCLTGDTQIHAIINNTLGTFPLKEIVRCFQDGDDIEVLSSTLKYQNNEWRTVKNAQLTGKKRIVSIFNKDDYPILRCTPDHLIYTHTRGWIQAQNLKHNDILEDTWGYRIFDQLYIVDESYNEDVYDLTVEGNHNFFANNILVHNCEILHPIKPIQHIDDPEGEIGCCVLSGINLLETKDEELKDVCDILVRMLDELIDLQEYPIKATERFTKNKRSLGIGIINLAAILARNKINYNDESCLTFTDHLFENIQYNLLLASNELAKEKGQCEDFNTSKYANGEFSFEYREKYIDQIIEFELENEWETLRENIKEHGLRHTTLSCVFPSESSSVIQNATNGIEPPRKLLSYKKSKSGVLPHLVPNFQKYKNFYTLAFDVSNSRYSEISGIILKWFDMAVSTNHYYDYTKYEKEQVPMSELIKDMFYLYKCGGKTLYYTNTKDTDEDTNCESGACAL